MADYKVYKSDNPAWNMVCALRHCLPAEFGNVITQALSWSHMHRDPPSESDLAAMGLAQNLGRRRMFNAAWVALHDPVQCYSDDAIRDPRVATPHMRQAYGAVAALLPLLPPPHQRVISLAMASHAFSALSPSPAKRSDDLRGSTFGSDLAAAVIWRQVTAALDAEIHRDWANVMRRVDAAERAEKEQRDRGYDR